MRTHLQETGEKTIFVLRHGWTPTNTNVLRKGKGATLSAELQLYEALACSRNHMDR